MDNSVSSSYRKKKKISRSIEIYLAACKVRLKMAKLGIVMVLAKLRLD